VNVVGEQVDEQLVINDQGHVRVLSALLRSEVGIVGHDLSDGSVVVSARHPVPQYRSCLGR
jgi:hypothetical protein